MTENGIRALLLAALRRGDEEEASAKLAHATPDEWQELLTLARGHRVAPLLYRKLDEKKISVPPEIMQEFHADYLRTAAKNMLRYHQMSVILKRFHEENIPVIPLKGLYLAEHVYRNIAVRSMDDVDILVKKEDISRVEQIVLEKGFLPVNKFRVICEENKHFEYQHPGKRQKLEVHWNLVNPSEKIGLNMDEIWEQSSPSSISGIATRSMSPEDLLYHLSVHAAMHVFGMGFRMIADIAETVVHFEGAIDWRLLHELSRERCTTRCLYICLQLAADLINAPVPVNFMRAIKPQNIESLYHSIVCEHLFTETKVEAQTFEKARWTAEVWAKKGFFGKVRLLWHRVFLSRQVMATMYPVSPGLTHVFWYYPVRMKDLIKRHGRSVWDLMRGNKQALAGVEQQQKRNELIKWMLTE